MTGKNQEICFWRPGLNPESSKKGSKNFWCWRRENSENLQSFEVLNCRTTTDWDCIRETADPETWVSAKHRLVGHATTSWLAEWAVAGVARSSSAAWKGFFPSFPGVFVIQVLKAEMASWSSWWYELCPNDLLLQLYDYDIFLLTIITNMARSWLFFWGALEV